MAAMATERRTAEQVFQLQREQATVRAQLHSALDEENMVGSPRVERLREAFEALDAELAVARIELAGRVYRVPDENLHGLEQRVAKINRRAAKLDVEPVHFVVTSETWELTRKSETTGEVIEVVPHTFVVVGSQVVKLAGWRFAATIEHDEEGNIIRQVPGVEADLAEYRTAAPWCFHCKTTRRRIDTFVVLHDDGRTEQVGRNCLVDFLGSSAKGAAAQAEWLHELISALEDAEDAGLSGARGVSTLGLEEFLTHVAMSIRASRWTSRGAAREWGYTATADHAERNMHEARKANYREPDADSRYALPADADAAQAKAAIEWARATWVAKPIDERDDFEHNMAVAVSRDYLPTRRLGLAAYAVQGYLKSIEETVRREAAATSEFVGTEGKRLRDVRVKLARAIAIADRRSYDGGTKPLYLFVDDAGNSLKWFAASWDTGIELEAGEEYLLTGTVKRHEDDETYGKATIITRCKLEEVKG